MSSAGFEPAIPATKRPKTYALDRAATGIGSSVENARDKILQLILVLLTGPRFLRMLLDCLSKLPVKNDGKI
jgi:hypothetical protein